MRIKLTIEIELEEGFIVNGTEDEKLSLENEVLVGDGNLVLHSNDIGDSVGVVKSVKNIQYLS